MKDLEVINALIKKAMKASLSLEELFEKWPEDFAENDFFESVFDDIESAVEHLPGDASGEVDWFSFQHSTEYRLLQYDLIILDYLNSEDLILTGLKELKNKIVSFRLSPDEIENEIEKMRIG